MKKPTQIAFEKGRNIILISIKFRDRVNFTVDLNVDDFKLHLITFLLSQSSVFLVLTSVCLP